MKKLGWLLVAIVGAFAIGGLAVHRGESINAMWLIVAAGCSALSARCTVRTDRVPSVPTVRPRVTP